MKNGYEELNNEGVNGEGKDKKLGQSIEKKNIKREKERVFVCASLTLQSSEQRK